MKFCPNCGARLRLKQEAMDTKTYLCDDCGYTSESGKTTTEEDLPNAAPIKAVGEKEPLSEEQLELRQQRTHFMVDLKSDANRCAHPDRFREWSMENPSQDIGWNVSERRTFRCEICGKTVTERV
jgi:predicted RNA-binding Zn-ribbon protein involved in translation (DUF1610 family)